MNSAMILCAGFGTRMNEFTKDTPKPMLPIKAKPILEYTVRHLAALNINKLVINLHYHADKIVSYFGDGKKFGVTIAYSYEEKPLGTAGGVRNVKDILNEEENFLVLYGDIVCNEDYQKLYSFHKSKEAVATIILHERAKSNSIVEVDDSFCITRFIERPDADMPDKRQNWVNSGLYCFNRKIFDYIPDVPFSDFPKDVFQSLIKKSKLYGYPLTGYRCAIDTQDRYFKVQKDFEESSLFQ